MPRHMLGVGAALLLAAFAQTQNKTYTVREGDSLSVIASKVGASQAAIAKANRLTSIHKLKPGVKLRIPAAARTAKKAEPASKGGYVVRAGDNDWAIAKRLKVTVAQLHSANPSAIWNKIRPGDTLRIPSSQLKSQIAAKYAKRKGSGGYIVKAGENDWTIAKKFNITPSKLRAMNAGVNWRAIQVGQRINVPGSKVMTAIAVKAINSKHAVINTDKVTVRRGPDVSHTALMTAAQSTPVTVLGKEGAWYKLQFPHGTIGWVRGDFLKAVSATKVASAKVAERKASNRYASAPKRVAANFTRRSSRSRRSSYKPAAGPVAPTRAAANGDMMAFAKSMLGTRYVWAGASRSGVDCSGFTTQVYKSVGVSLPRTSRAQSQFGQPVSRGQLAQGDLVFFTGRGSRRISHVGIYMAGNKIIHSSSGRGRVVIDDLSGYYGRQFAWARRVTGVATASRKSKRKPVDKAQVKPKVEPKTEDTLAPGGDKKEENPPKSTKGVDEIGK